MARRSNSDPEQLQDTVRISIDNAVSWIESEISPRRMNIEDYYEGKTAVKSNAGRSKITVTAVRDTIHAILPSLARIFTQTDQIGEFSSEDEEDQGICTEQTIYVNNVYNKHNGYVALIQACTDALKSLVGCIHVKFEKKEINNNNTINNVDEYQLDLLKKEAQSGKFEIVDVTPAQPPQGPQQPGMPPQQNVQVNTITTRNIWELSCVAPEKLIVDVHAVIGKQPNLIGMRETMPIMDIASTWEEIDVETLMTFPSDDDSSLLSEENRRRRRLDPLNYEEITSAPTTRRLLVTEVWMQLDVENIGRPELRHLICIGSNYQIMINEPAICIPLAVFSHELMPHVFFPICVGEDLIEDQNSQTAVTRSIIDNVALTNSPRTLCNDALVNIDDLKNTEIAAIIRTKNMDAVRDLIVPFVAGQTLPVLEFMRQNTQAKSGVTPLSQGLDPNALQATSRIAANAAVQGSDARLEMMARNLAETGVKSLFKIILQVAMYNLDGEQQIRTADGSFKTIKPYMWHDQVSIEANVGLGNGRIEEKVQTLDSLLQFQMGVLQQYGPDSPFMKWDNIRNTAKHRLRLVGLRNTTDFIPVVTPEAMQAWQVQQDQKQKQAAQQQQGAQGPAPDVVGAAKIKAESDMMVNQAKIQAQQQADMAKLSSAQQNLIAQLKQQHQLKMAELEATYGKDLEVAMMNEDQRRDAANQKFATDSYKIGMDAQTQLTVARENIANSPKLNGSKKTQ